VILAGGRWRLPALLGLLGFGLLPLLPVLTALWSPLEPLERLASHWFDLHCHRDPARTLQLAGVPLAVCARCSGIYLGLGLGAAVRRPQLPPRSLRLWLLAAAAAMALDVWLEARDLHGAWAWLRLTTGLLLAYPVGAALGRLCLAPAGAPTRAHSP
jgi:uncharacterized membrane protein